MRLIPIQFIDNGKDEGVLTVALLDRNGYQVSSMTFYYRVKKNEGTLNDPIYLSTNGAYSVFDLDIDWIKNEVTEQVTAFDIRNGIM